MGGNASKPAVSFIGLGDQGLPMAVAIAQAGYPLHVWARQPPGKPGQRAFAGILDRLAALRAIGLDRDVAGAVRLERLRRLCQEGARLTGQHLRTLEAGRRRATLVSTAFEKIVTLTDDAVLMFNRLLGQMLRCVERGEEAAMRRDRRTINGKIRLLARLGDALIAAKASGDDAIAAVEAIVGWEDLGREVDEANRQAQAAAPDREQTSDPER